MKAGYIFLIVAILVLLPVTFGAQRKKRKTKVNTEPKNYTPQDAEQAIKTVSAKYGAATAQQVEKIFRYETGHFTSEQYKRTGTAGMTTSGQWENLPKLPTVTGIGKTNKAGERSDNVKYYVWNPTDFAIYLAEFLNRHGGNAGRWNSRDAGKQFAYTQALTGVKTKFV